MTQINLQATVTHLTPLAPHSVRFAVYYPTTETRIEYEIVKEAKYCAHNQGTIYNYVFNTSKSGDRVATVPLDEASEMFSTFLPITRRDAMQILAAL